MAKSYFAILGVSSHSSCDEIRSAYRRLAKEFHPDRFEGGTGPFKEIQEAYSVLGDAQRRKEYERSLSKLQTRRHKINIVRTEPEPLIPEQKPLDFGEMPVSIAFPSGLNRDHAVIVPLDRYGIRNIHVTVLFRPADMD